MNPLSLIPGPDPAPLAGPSWIFHVLWVVTFFIHILAVDLVLGGAILALYSALHQGAPGNCESLRFYTALNSWAIPAAITMGVAPLLFVQVMLGRFFYTATLLIPRAWLSLLVLLAAAYALNHLIRSRLRNGGGTVPLLALQVLCFLAIAGIQVSVAVLQQRPSIWRAAAGNIWVIFADRTFVPRLLHFVLAGIAVAGIVLARWRVRRLPASLGEEPEARHQQAQGTEIALAEVQSALAEARSERTETRSAPTETQSLGAQVRLGLQAALAATALGVISGLWLLSAVPLDVQRGFMRLSMLMPLALGVFEGIGALVLIPLLLSADPLRKPRLVRHVLELIVGAVAFMVVTRHQVRLLYLAPYRRGERVEVAPQWGMIILFLIVFAAAAVLTIYAIRRIARERPPREAA
jgi:hypothetical protein